MRARHLLSVFRYDFEMQSSSSINSTNYNTRRIRHACLTRPGPAVALSCFHVPVGVHDHRKLTSHTRDAWHDLEVREAWCCTLQVESWS